MREVIDAFCRALGDRGIASNNLKADGAIHRCGTLRKPRSSNGVYCLHLDGAVPAGWFQNHEDGLGVTVWRAEGAVATSEAERRAWQQEMRRRQAEREAERFAGHRGAARKAQRIWDELHEASPAHRYLARKHIGAHGARVHKGLLVVPLFDALGELVNLQFIAADGAKRFLTGARKQGCFHVIGERDSDPLGLCIGEGFATMATVFEATGQMCVVAFDCGNLKPVAQAWRTKLPDARIVICADNDPAGLDHAHAAARSIKNCTVIWPNARSAA